jgi:AraC-like DNA-binding protein
MRPKPRKRDTQSLPAVHALHLAELVGRWGVTPGALLKGSGLDKEQLAAPGRRLPVDVFVQLVERARALTREPALGIYFGLQMRVSWHGYLGLAAMTSANPREALELATHFLPTQTGALALAFEEHGAKASLRIDERADFGAARDAIVLALVVGIWQLGCTLTGRQLEGRADLAIPEPAYIARWKGMMPGALHFGRPEHRLIFDASTLDQPFATADAAALLLTREQCERELQALGFAGPFRERVRGLALLGSGGARTLDEVAEQLHVSARTLKRRLAELGTGYSELLDEEREARARALLRGTTLTIDEIAERLGYSDVANFSRAFRRWTGTTPGQLRQGARRGAAARRGPPRASPRRSRR